jgi:hypothetical protein
MIFSRFLIKILYLGFSGTFLLSSIAYAGSLRYGYNASRPERVSQKRTVGSGSRSGNSCQSSWEKDSLVLLVPEAEVVHLTANSSPSLYFYARIDENPSTVKFNLVNPVKRSQNPLVQKTITIDKSGIYRIDLEDKIELDTNELYLWQIGIPCENNSDRFQQILRAGIKKIEMSESLKREIESAESTRKTEIYAEQGLWYDALNSAEGEDFQQLITQVNIDFEDLVMGE